MAVSDPELSIYDDDDFADIDVGSRMREGHPDIVEGDEHIVSLVRSRAAGGALRVLDVGSGSGDLTVLIARELPLVEVVAIEPSATVAEQARAKVVGLPNASVFASPFDRWSEPVDVIVSWGSHHHLGHDYLQHVARLLGPDGLFVVGDEFCPEYLAGDDAARLVRSELVEIVDGYVFDNDDDLEVYRTSGVVPEWAAHLEERRRQALWRWYRFVGDYAAERQAWDVVIAELAIARNDLVTRYGGEHKTSPLLLERELALAGFELVGRQAIGDRPTELQSFVIYHCRPEGNGR